MLALQSFLQHAEYRSAIIYEEFTFSINLLLIYY